MSIPRLSLWRIAAFLSTAVLCLAAAGAGRAQSPAGAELVEALRGGGHVILMRHAAATARAPDPPDPENRNLERELDETGLASAAAMGEAFRRLGISIGAVLSSPTYRTLQTARSAGWGQVTSEPALGDDGGDPEWLRTTIGRSPQAGGNTILITHGPNVRAMFPDQSAVAEGEALVLRPDGRGGADLVARVRIEQWPELQ
jgi:phosphohistidine phosphatase SixA